ncbi:hypothetical protein [Propionivibrio sp.]|uniref:hypothetical protein n=1 Tax=Propionivibrio sp. TaxID=2212460 RepID=UPI003BEF9F70
MSNTSQPSSNVTADKDKEVDTFLESELSEEALDKVSGGSIRTSRLSVTGPGTQTEDDVYVG